MIVLAYTILNGGGGNSQKVLFKGHEFTCQFMHKIMYTIENI